MSIRIWHKPFLQFQLSAQVHDPGRPQLWDICGAWDMQLGLAGLFRTEAKRECSQPWGSLKTLAATCERHQLHFGGIHGMRENKFRCSIVRAQVRTENLEGKINRRTKKKRKEKTSKTIVCLSPGSNWGPLVCETNVITNYTTQTLCQERWVKPLYTL